MSTQSARIFLFRIHQWIGLNICIVLGIIFASGTLLVFANEVEAWFYLDRTSAAEQASSPPTYGKIYDTLHAAYPDARIYVLRKSSGHDLLGDRATLIAPGGRKFEVRTDGATGEILGASPVEGVKAALRAFHDSLFSGHIIGRLAVTAFAFALLVSIVTGLISYRRFWRGAFRLPDRRRGPRGWWGGMHRLLAVWSIPFLLVMALTGIYYFVAEFKILPKERLTAKPVAERMEALPPGFNGASVERAIEAAQTVFPGFQPGYIILPLKKHQGIAMAGKADDTGVTLLKNTILIDPSGYSVLRSQSVAETSILLSHKLLAEIFHHGHWGGLPTRVLWFLFGAIGTVLLFAGAMVYASRVAHLPRAGTTAPERRSAFGSLWHGMFIGKWALIPAAAIVACIGIWRYVLM